MVLRPAGKHWGSSCRRVGAAPSTGYGAVPVWHIRGIGTMLLSPSAVGGFGLAFLAAPWIRPAQVLSEVWEKGQVNTW